MRTDLNAICLDRSQKVIKEIKVQKGEPVKGPKGDIGNS